MNRIEPYTEEFTVERRVNSSMSQGERPTTESIQNTDFNISNAPSNEKIVLKRHLGLFSAVTFIIGTIIGEQIFNLIFRSYFTIFRYWYLHFSERRSAGNSISWLMSGSVGYMWTRSSNRQDFSLVK